MQYVSVLRICKSVTGTMEYYWKSCKEDFSNFGCIQVTSESLTSKATFSGDATNFVALNNAESVVSDRLCVTVWSI